MEAEEEAGHGVILYPGQIARQLIGRWEVVQLAGVNGEPGSPVVRGMGPEKTATWYRRQGAAWTLASIPTRDLVQRLREGVKCRR